MSGTAANDSTVILYDAAVCLGVVEPYIVEHSVTLSGVEATFIATKNNTLSDTNKAPFLIDGQELGTFDRTERSEGVARTLNSTDLYTAFNLSYQNSVLNMLLV